MIAKIFTTLVVLGLTVRVAVAEGAVPDTPVTVRSYALLFIAHISPMFTNLFVMQ